MVYLPNSVPCISLWLMVQVQGDFYSDVAKFCFENGLNYITLSSSPYLRNETSHVFNAFLNYNLQLRQLQLNQIEGNYILYQDSLVLLAKSAQLDNISSFKEYLSFMSMAKVKRGLLVFTTLFDEKNMLQLQSVVDLLNFNSLFYVAYEDEKSASKTEYLQVITLRNAEKGIINQIELTSSGIVIEDYDLNGLTIKDQTLQWAPYYIIENCDLNGRNCDTSGFYHDYTLAMGRIMNFTWETQKELNGDWGVAPISGPFNKSGVWGGVMGGIVNGDYMISLCQWVWLSDRYGLVDFISTTADFHLLALTPRAPEVDLGLFVRPFTIDAWKGKYMN